MQVDLVIGRMAQKIFSRHRFHVVDEACSPREVAKCFDKHRPDLLLTSTSWKSNLEQVFRNRAHKLSIPSVVVMDFWSNYRMRWQHADYRFEEGYDHLCVMDLAMARALRREGYPKTKLHIMGHPHLESFASFRQRKPATQRRAFSAQRVLLLSIPLAALGMQESPLMPIRMVCKALGQWGISSKKNIQLSIRQHPHEKKDPNFIIQARSFASPGTTVRLADNTQSLKNTIMAHDYILGYVTMALFEARALGKQAIAMEVTPYASDLKSALKAAGIQLVRFTPMKIAACLDVQSRQSHHLAPPSYSGSSALVIALCRQLTQESRRRFVSRT